MRIAIASGKGGAGKTTVTASLHSAWPRPHIMADTDVEAPNLHLFLHPQTERSVHVDLDVPTAVTGACTACGKCRDICRFGAVARFGEKMMFFTDMCHGCGGCFAVCPHGALVSGKRSLGDVEIGSLADGTPYISGTTRIGEVMTPPVLRVLLAELDGMDGASGADVLIDSPPGVSCPAVTVAQKVDAVLLVVDPTPFGFADFRIAWQAYSSLGKPLAAVINRGRMPGNEGGDEAVAAFCREHSVPLLGIIPFSREAAGAVANGSVLPDLGGEWKDIFVRMSGDMLRRFGEVRHA